MDTSYWTNRDLSYPRYLEKAARMAYEMAGITDPRKDIHVVEPYDPFAYKELHHLEGLMLADKGEASKLVESGFGTGIRPPEFLPAPQAVCWAWVTPSLQQA